MLTQAPRGTKDMLPQDSGKWQAMEAEMREAAHAAGYMEVRTPVFEHTELFLRGVGDTTDIVQKEMYTFLDKGERSITLKPEGTAGAVRALLESGLYAQALPCKMYYLNNPIFRYETPQSGRYREHHQFGMECFGSPSPSVDAELIVTAARLLTKLGMRNVGAHINSIGCPTCRPRYQEALRAFLREREAKLCRTCQTRMERNPMRALDCKEPACREALRDAPTPMQFLCEDCRAHFETLRGYLDAAGLPYAVDERIVRGLDYYTKTVFELITATPTGELTVCGGGRYDGLVAELGGPDMPAAGFGMGMERVLMLLAQQEGEGAPAARPVGAPDVFVACLGAENLTRAFSFTMALRARGVKADMDHLTRSLKAQFKFAGKADARLVAIIGGDELARGVVKVRDMATREERELPLDGAPDGIAELLCAKAGGDAATDASR